MRSITVAALFGAMPMTMWLSHEPLPYVHDHRHGHIFEAQPAPDAIEVEVHRITAYCACPICCGQWADGYTALGTVAKQGRTAAADTRVWGMRSCITIQGVGNRIVEDTGSAIKGNRIDVYFNNHDEALAFGVRLVPVLECV